MELIVRAFPILRGKEAELDILLERLRKRGEEARDFYERFHVARETWHRQETEHGSWIIGVTQIDGASVPNVARDYSESAHEFDRWFKDAIHSVTGIHPDREPLGPPTELVFDTDELP